MRTKPLQTVLTKIGDGLSSLRMQKGYNTIKAFVNDHELPLIQYWRIERGKANITIKTLSHLLSIHNKSIEDFFCELEEKSKETENGT